MEQTNRINPWVIYLLLARNAPTGKVEHKGWKNRRRYSQQMEVGVVKKTMCSCVNIQKNLDLNPKLVRRDKRKGNNL